VDHVTSVDGTSIAYERTGSGPPLVLVHGSLNDHNIWAQVRPAFAERHTVYAIDRRGRGESGPATDHAFQREVEDVSSVIEAAGGEVDLIGHSYGAHCVLDAALMAPERIKHLVLYEPPTVNDMRGEVATLFETEEPPVAVEAFLRDTLGTPPEQIALIKQSPFLGYMASFALTMPPEARALVGRNFDPASYSVLRMPALFLVGAQTSERLGAVLRQLEAHVPQAEWHVFEGQGHGAMLTAPQPFAEAVLEFLAR
jgi:pimeloyl-ACP methyl ester carboxylesterase